MTSRAPLSARRVASRENTELRARLSEAEETIRAIRTGEADAVVTSGRAGLQVFSLQGVDHAYRELIESMTEGALTLTKDKVILYANQSFARLMKCPLEQVIGSSFRRFISNEDRARLRPLLRRAGQAGAQIQVHLHGSDGSLVPAQISLRPLAKSDSRQTPVGLVVTDMTEVRRAEMLQRALTHRIVEVQEAERGRVALELHDNVTQLLCAVLLSSQALADSLSARDGPAKKKAVELRQLVGQTAEEVERISQNLRPSLLDQLGLVAACRGLTGKFTARTGVRVKLACPPSEMQLPAETELTLYRMLQEALKNIERHARARRVTVRLTQSGAVVQLVVRDDGIGFSPDAVFVARKGAGGLSLLGLRERASYLGGTLAIKSVRGSGTTIEARIPLTPAVAAGQTA